MLVSDVFASALGHLGGREDYDNDHDGRHRHHHHHRHHRHWWDGHRWCDEWSD
jgi:hypothetical protein